MSSVVRRAGLLLLFVSLWTSAVLHPVQAQEEVQLTLQDQSDNEGEVLPEGTKVLVLQEEGSRAESLEQLGIARDDLRSRLLDRAKNEPAALLDTLDTDGKTRRSYTKQDLHYPLARTPEGKLYESQVGDDPGFDLVVSGEMKMASVPDGELDGVFEKVVNAATKTRLRLNQGGTPLPQNTEVRVWARAGQRSQTVQDRSFLKEKAIYKVKLGNGEETERKFGQTWHSDTLLYVAARMPDGTFYETVDGGGAAFKRVESGEMNIQAVGLPSQKEALRPVFESSSGGNYGGLKGWAIWIALLLLGIVLGLAGAWWWYEKKISRVKRKKNELKAELRKKAREEHSASMPQRVSPDSSKTKNGKEETVEKMRTKNDELRREIYELKEKVQKRNEELRELKQDATSSSSAQSSQTAAEQTSSSSTPQNPARRKTGETFTQWCTEKGPAMVDRYQLFEQKVEKSLSDASFRRITREKNAAGLLFDNDAQDPVEYWLVEAGGQHFLLPQPSRGRFRELGECFEGQNKAPSDVSSVQPALLKRKGGQLVLEEKGQIT